MSDFLKNLAKNEAKSISERLSSETKKELYKIFKKEEIMKDMEKIAMREEQFVSLTDEQKAELLNNASNEYVYNNKFADYDLNYKDHIEAVFEDELDNYLAKERA